MATPEFGFQWHLTDRCNLRCTHCYQDSYRDENPLNLDAQVALAGKIFAALPSCEHTINLTGGEPFLLPYLAELVVALGVRDRTQLHIITNGTVESPALVEVLAREKSFRSIKVSLEAVHPILNDRIRGAGHFERVQRGIEGFLHAGLRVDLMVTLARYNVSNIEQIVRWARERNIAGVLFERFVPLGVGRQTADRVLGAEHWREALIHIARAAEVEVELTDLLPFTAFWFDTTPGADDPLRGAFCNLGAESMALMPDGTVYPCRRLPAPLGNLRTDPFGVILQRLAAFAGTARCARQSDETVDDADPCGNCLALATACRGTTR